MNPRPSWLPVAAGVTLGLVGVGAFIAGRRMQSAPGGVGKIPIKKVVFIPGGAQASKTDEEVMMTDLHGYTSFFTKPVEQELINRLADYRAANGLVDVSDCGPDEVYNPFEARWDSVGFKEGNEALAQALTELYPEGAPWDAHDVGRYPTRVDAEGAGIALWRWWLWNRTHKLANKYVCNWVPVT